MRGSFKMNKKEVLEIRKQFKPENCAITRICGCYVDHEKNKKIESKSAFLSLPEEEAFKYYDIFKQTLSGTIGKNLLNMEFPLEQEKPEGKQEFLLKLRDSKLQEDDLIEEFYDKVIENYIYAENYYIILIHAVYDVPGKSSDGMEMFDASDAVYEHILCSICPVTLSKAGLSYNPGRNSIEDRIRDWIVQAPVSGFLFPAFIERTSDIHNVLYYSKNPEEIHTEFIEQVLGSEFPMTAKDQKESFHSIITETFGEECNYEVVRSIHENLQEMIEEHKEDPEPLKLSKPEVKKLLEKNGAEQEKVDSFEEKYEDFSLLADNITSARKFQIDTPDIAIKVNPERTDLIQTRMIDGRKCLVIAVDEYVEVNGVMIKTMI